MNTKRILTLVLSLLMVLCITLGFTACELFDSGCNHQWEDATCTEAKTCSICGETDGNALGHTVVKDEAKAPTCTEAGLTEGSHCSVCNTVIQKQDTVNATGHKYSPVVTDPDCENWGYTTYVCECGHSYVDDKVSPVEHVYGEWEEYVAPTCISEGLDRRYCKNCDHYEEKTVEALDHLMSDWFVAVEPGCESKGTERSDCDRCDHYVTKEIPATGHSYESVVTAPTCTEQGYTTHTCACGDTYKDNFVAANGHSMVEESVVSDPTCIKAGVKRIDCSECDYYTTEAIPATGHSHESVVTAPTCTEQGYTSPLNLLSRRGDLPSLRSKFSNLIFSSIVAFSVSFL